MNKKIISALKNYDKSGELKSNLIATNNSLEKITKKLIAETQNLQKNKKYQEVIELIEAQKSLSQFIERNEEIIDEIEDSPITEATYPLTEDFCIDPDKPFDLNQDFRFTKPYAFQINKDIVEVSSWREVLIETANYLNRLNPDIMQSFIEDKSMHWGDTFNFATDKNSLRNPALIENSNIYIETSKTSNAVRQLVKKMLDKYEIDFNNYNIFLRADASERYIK